jgi:hypothetical protein
MDTRKYPDPFCTRILTLDQTTILPGVSPLQSIVQETTATPDFDDRASRERLSSMPRRILVGEVATPNVNGVSDSMMVAHAKPLL